MQASLQEHTVVESKPDNTVEDLRFHQPWTQLERFADSIDLASADDITHKHVPYGGCPITHYIAAFSVQLLCAQALKPTYYAVSMSTDFALLQPARTCPAERLLAFPGSCTADKGGARMAEEARQHTAFWLLPAIRIQRSHQVLAAPDRRRTLGGSSTTLHVTLQTNASARPTCSGFQPLSRHSCINLSGMRMPTCSRPSRFRCKYQLNNPPLPLPPTQGIDRLYQLFFRPSRLGLLLLLRVQACLLVLKGKCCLVTACGS